MSQRVYEKRRNEVADTATPRRAVVLLSKKNDFPSQITLAYNVIFTSFVRFSCTTSVVVVSRVALVVFMPSLVCVEKADRSAAQARGRCATAIRLVVNVGCSSWRG